MTDEKRYEATGKKLTRWTSCTFNGCPGGLSYAWLEMKERDTGRLAYVLEANDAECAACGSHYKLDADGKKFTVTRVEDGETGDHARDAAKKEGDA